MHVPGRDHTNQRIVLAQGENDVQPPPVMRLAQRMKSQFLPAMVCIVQQQQWLLEKHLLCIGLADAVLLILGPIFATCAGCVCQRDAMETQLAKFFQGVYA